MFALEFRFPVGRYHATPWGRGVNEAAVAWPPEPWRLLRAVIASYWRNGGTGRGSADDLADLIDLLAGELPLYHLPEGAIHAHTRHYMPVGVLKKGREDTKIVFDAFVRIPRAEPLVAAWPSVTLRPAAFAMASELATGIRYLGRAESWTDCSALREPDDIPAMNCRPVVGSSNGQTVRVLAPLTSAGYVNRRQELLKRIENELLGESDRPLSEKRLHQEMQESVTSKATGRNTLPPRLTDALSLDTSDWQDRGWSQPPAAREVLYGLDRNAVPGVVPQVRRAQPRRNPVLPKVARFLLAGRPLPRVEESVRIGELMRLATMHKFGWEKDACGRRYPKAPWQVSGRGPDGKPLRNPQHDHAFWLPEDMDGDGLIDHLAVFVRGGIPDAVQRGLDRLTRLWEPVPSGPEGRPAAGQREWRLALEGFGSEDEFAAGSRIFGSSRRWRSVTPFLASGHLKAAGHCGEAVRLLRLRGADVTDLEVLEVANIVVGGSSRHSLQFHRFRRRGREKQLDTRGAFLEIAFGTPQDGPLALGYGCHFGLGLFGRVEE